MRIKEMTATFGPLDHATLAPGDGLTLIQAPNESGKSTWCAFLRAMLYGFPARDRDREGHLAEKNRHQPWSGAPMEGTVTLEWQGRDITLYRGPKGAAPWGTFSAVYTATQEPVEGLTAENCGEVLLGVSREVFERTAFVGQGGIALSHSADLEKRVASLATSGDEEVSFSQVERRLKDWLNRRKHNKTGLIPKLEAELSQVQEAIARQGSLLRRAQEARQEKEELETQKAGLEARLQAHAALQNAQRARRRQEAQANYDAALAEFETARRAALSLPRDEVLREAQGDLRYLNTIEANLKEAASALPEAKERLAEATVAATTDPLFGGKDVSLANEQTRGDYNEVLRLQKGRPLLLFLFLGALAGYLLTIPFRNYLIAQATGFFNIDGINGAMIALMLLPFILFGAVIGLLLWFFRRAGHRHQATAILDYYGVHTPEDILKRSSEYGQKVAAVQDTQREVQAMESERDKLAGQKEELTAALFDLVRPFAPEVTHLFGVSAALSRALGQGERYRAAQTKLEHAEKLLSALPAPTAEAGPVPVTPPEGNPTQLTARLGAANGELAHAADTAARLQGELDSIGDPGELSARRDALTEQLALRRGEYDSIAAALESLKNADSILRERFSPELNREAGAYLSALTGGKYTQAALTRQFQALAQEAGASAPRPDLALSGGAAQQLYLAVRLAMCDLALPQAGPCPILLDDALNAFDDERAKLALECLMEVAGRRQVMLFTCHGREGELLKGKDVKILSMN